MKKLFTVLLLAVVWTACNKDKDVEAVPEKTYLLKKRSHVQGRSAWSIEYTFDANGKMLQCISAGSLSNYVLTASRDDHNRIVRADFDNAAYGYRTYEYDAGGNLSRVNFYSLPGGAIYAYTIYNFTATGYEAVRYNPSGTLNGKDVYQFTADKKNIALQKTYNASGIQTQEKTFTYTNKRSEYYVEPERAMQILSSGFCNQNGTASVTTKTLPAGSSYSEARSQTYNADGYAISSQATYTNEFEDLKNDFELINGDFKK
ncbi:hypothetical protein [Niabella drilacis]|uniref:Uncharacterized protein n=1 Tax=Niabella drilacis (strain DSM 25811 / CCM 8410 / CCUG 62505 / LMG 26954 / E90) TaxID=1285928 RepID=A0A1G6Z2R7_NIADE|nr:hypothetical protein [Niabella drilacis]SDD96949.1 hypothetical protein SAMN04487894_11735 [Niabella drilacis]